MNANYITIQNCDHLSEIFLNHKSCYDCLMAYNKCKVPIEVSEGKHDCSRHESLLNSFGLQTIFVQFGQEQKRGNLMPDTNCSHDRILY